jgi:O-antigen/teichoic acid export membrane protein
VFRQTYVNVLSNVGVLVLKLAITFIMTPVLVENLGNYDYGIWEITASIVGYFGLLEVGLRPAVTRFTARYRSLSRAGDLRALYATASALLGISGLIASCSFLIWAWSGPDALVPDGADATKYRWFLVIIGVQLLIVMPSYVAESILDGFQRFHLKNLVTVVNTLIGTGLVLALISPDNALLIVAGLNAAGLSVKYLVYQRFIRRAELGDIRWRPGLVSARRARELLVFGGKSFVQGASGQLLNSFPNIVIGLTVGVSQVVFYSIPRSLANHVQNLVRHVTIVFMPMFADLTAAGRVADARAVFFPVTSLIVAVMTLAALGIATLGDHFIAVWIGPEYGERVRWLAVIFAVTLWVWNANPLDSKLLTAMDRHGTLARLHPLRTVVGMLASTAGAFLWGLEGIALGIAVAGLVIFVPVLRATCQALEVTTATYVRRALLPCVVPALSAFGVCVGMVDQLGAASYLSIFTIAAVMSLVFAVVYLLFAGAGTRRLAFRLLNPAVLIRS